MEDVYLAASEQPRPPQRAQTALAAVIALLLAVGAAGAFTVRGGGHTGDAAGRVSHAAGEARKAGTQRFAMTFKIAAGGREITFTESGVIDVARNAGTVHVDFGSALTGPPVDLLVVGSTIYVAVPESRRGSTNGKPWMSVDASGFQGQGLGTGKELLQNLDLLSTVGQQVQTVGHEKLDGVATTHYRASLDAMRLLDRLPPALQAQAAQLRAAGVTVAPLVLDVWLDSDGRPVRFDDSFTAQGTTATASMVLSDFGKPVTATAPRPADAFGVTDITTALRLLGIGPR